MLFIHSVQKDVVYVKAQDTAKQSVLLGEDFQV